MHASVTGERNGRAHLLQIGGAAQSLRGGMQDLLERNGRAQRGTLRGRQRGQEQREHAHDDGAGNRGTPLILAAAGREAARCPEFPKGRHVDAHSASPVWNFPQRRTARGIWGELAARGEQCTHANDERIIGRVEERAPARAAVAHPRDDGDASSRELAHLMARTGRG